MNFRTTARAIFPLAALFILTGCKDAEVQGTWSGSEASFKPEIITNLFSNVQKTLGDEHVSVSGLKDEAGHKVFYVTLGDNEHSKEWVEKVLADVKQYQASLNTSASLRFLNIDEVKDKEEKDFLQAFMKLREKTGESDTTQIQWAKSEVQVYTHTQKNSMSSLTSSLGHNNIYCRIEAPLTKALPSTAIKDLLPDLTAEDIPVDERNKMSAKKITHYLQEKNKSRRELNQIAQVIPLKYPHEIIFGDEFMSKLSANKFPIELPKTYTFDGKSIAINYGVLPDKNTDFSIYVGQDFGGVLHDKCREMIKEITPELEKKMTTAMGYNDIAQLSIAPEWKPADPQK